MAILLAHQAVTHPATVVGTPLNLQIHGIDEVHVECYHGFNQGSAANTNPGSFLIQTSLSASGNEDWVTPVEFPVANGTPSDEVLSVGEPLGETALEVVDASTFAGGDLIYIRDTVIADSEWALVREVDITPAEFIHIVDGLARAHAVTTTQIFGSAEKFAARINVKAIERIRAVYLHEGVAGLNVHIKALIKLIEHA